MKTREEALVTTAAGRGTSTSRCRYGYKALIGRSSQGRPRRRRGRVASGWVRDRARPGRRDSAFVRRLLSRRTFQRALSPLLPTHVCCQRSARPVAARGRDRSRQWRNESGCRGARRAIPFALRGSRTIQERTDSGHQLGHLRWRERRRHEMVARRRWRLEGPADRSPRGGKFRVRSLPVRVKLEMKTAARSPGVRITRRSGRRRRFAKPDAHCNRSRGKLDPDACRALLDRALPR